MRRRFYDLLVSADILTRDALERVRDLGFAGVGASISAHSLAASPERVLELVEGVRRAGEEVGLDVVARLTVSTPMGEGALKRLLRKWRRRFEVISVHAVNRQVTAFASRDTRVDVVTLLPGSRLLRGDLDYMRDFGKRVELLLAPLQSGSCDERASALAYALESIEMLKKAGVTLVFSSGAVSIDQLRDPRSMAALLSTLGLSPEQALDALSRNAAELVAEAREKLRGVVPVRGVRVITRGRPRGGGEAEKP